MFTKLLSTAGLLTLISCGIDSPPDKEQQLVAGDYNMVLSSFFICAKTIDSDDATNYANLELSAPIKMVYSVFAGTNTTNIEKVVRAEMDTRYREDGTGFNSEDFEVAAEQYIFDTGNTSTIYLAKDIKGDNSNGVWTFSVNSSQPSAVYTDSDLAASPVTINFDLTDGSSECSGSYQNS